MSNSQRTVRQDGLALRCYLAFSNFSEPLYRIGLRRRLKRSREDPLRYREKLGYTARHRPEGRLIWLHGVGLGEVLALRSLIDALDAKQAHLSFLVTSSTNTSAGVFEKNCPPNTIHQFLPVDAPGPIGRFLDHWQPEVSVWAEQDLWPALVYYTHKRRIPLAIVNARMNATSYRSRARAARLYKDLYTRFEFISAQDDNTAAHMQLLGARVTTGGSLKAAAIPLDDPVAARTKIELQLKHRLLWLAASSHRADETLALQAHQQLLKAEPEALLIIAPRFPNRTNEINDLCDRFGLRTAVRSRDDSPDNAQAYIADTFGEMGLWYRICCCALIGGTNSTIEGHNPWEAAALNCAITHGPNTANFNPDYQSLAKHHAAQQISSAADIFSVLQNRDLQKSLSANALTLAQHNKQKIQQMAQDILALLETEATATAGSE